MYYNIGVKSMMFLLYPHPPKLVKGMNGENNYQPNQPKEPYLKKTHPTTKNVRHKLKDAFLKDIFFL
jgi:hypothetical protein